MPDHHTPKSPTARKPRKGSRFSGANHFGHTIRLSFNLLKYKLSMATQKHKLEPLSDDIAPAKIYVPPVAQQLIEQQKQSLSLQPTTPQNTPQPPPDPSREVSPITFLPQKGAYRHSVLVRLLFGAVLSGLVAAIIIWLIITGDNSPTFAFDFAFVFPLVILFVVIQIVLLNTWALERIFQKAGRTWWHAWILFYNTMIIYEIAGMSKHWAWLNLFPSPNSLTSKDPALERINILLRPVFIITTILRTLAVITSIGRLARHFNKSALLILLTPFGIPFLVLGFGDATYHDDYESLPPGNGAPTPWSIVWRGLLLSAIFLVSTVLVYSFIMGVMASTLLNLFLAPIYLILFIIAPIGVGYFIVHWLVDDLRRTFAITNYSTIKRHLYGFMAIGYHVLLAAVIFFTDNRETIPYGSTITLTDVLPLILAPVLLPLPFIFMNTAYFVNVVFFTQKITASKSTRFMALKLPLILITVVAIPAIYYILRYANPLT